MSEQLHTLMESEVAVVIARPALADELLATRLRDTRERICERLNSLRRAWRWIGADEPELRKHLARLRETLGDLARLNARRAIAEEHKADLTGLLGELDAHAARLQLDEAASVLYELRRLLVRVGDAEIVCGLAEDELHWKKGQTSWITWDELFGDSIPPAVEQYRRGLLPGIELEEVRQNLLTLYRVRRDDQEAYLSRAQTRARILRLLSASLFALLSSTIALYGFGLAGAADASTLTLIVAGGALGAALSGTLKSRDHLTRQADIRRFMDGFLAQLLVGASLAFLVVVIVDSGLVTIAGVDVTRVSHGLAIAFVAGFSEPFALDVVGRVSKLASSTDPAATSVK